jgi:hypothetical protein
MEYLAREAEHHDEGHQRSPGSPDLQVTKVSWQLIPRMDSEPHPRRNLKKPTTSAITIRELQTHQAEGQALATTVKHHYSYISASRRRRVIAHVVGDLAQARVKLPSMRSRTALSEVSPERRAVPVMERYPAWI